MPPRIAKSQLSAREVAELFEYVRRNPIDDQSNFHYPIANLITQLYRINFPNAPPRKLREFLLFRDPEADDGIEDDILNGDW